MQAMDEPLEVDVAIGEISAAIEGLEHYIDRLAGLIQLQQRTGRGIDSDWPAQFLITGNELADEHDNAQRVFFRYLCFYRSTEEDWIVASRQQINMTFSAGLLDVFREKRNILKRCLAVLRVKSDRQSPSPTDIKRTHYHFGDTHMGDVYNTNQAGAVGPNAHVHGGVTQNAVAQGSIDLNALGTDLSLLRTAMKNQAESADQDEAVGHIASAERASKDGNEKAVIRHLKAAGHWAFDVANKIGVTVASGALKSALGL